MAAADVVPLLLKRLPRQPEVLPGGVHRVTVMDHHRLGDLAQVELGEGVVVGVAQCVRPVNFEAALQGGGVDEPPRHGDGAGLRCDGPVAASAGLDALDGIVDHLAPGGVLRGDEVVVEAGQRGLGEDHVSWSAPLEAIHLLCSFILEVDYAAEDLQARGDHCEASPG